MVEQRHCTVLDGWELLANKENELHSKPNSVGILITDILEL